MKINSILKFQNNAHSNPVTIDVTKITRQIHTNSRGVATEIGNMDLVHFIRDYAKLQRELAQANQMLADQRAVILDLRQAQKITIGG
tara:strand:+ start:3159 stop:3419 length:261 start_codon:yes stop_codon:yes gene_type:complete